MIDTDKDENGTSQSNPRLSDPPNPGSEEAQKMGCSCPVLENSNGRGYMGMEDVFVYRQGCPIHGSNSLDQSRDLSR
jgi:hypothetical protein